MNLDDDADDINLDDYWQYEVVDRENGLMQLAIPVLFLSITIYFCECSKFYLGCLAIPTVSGSSSSRRRRSASNAEFGATTSKLVMANINLAVVF